MLESLTVVGVGSEESRERRAPWRVLKFLEAKDKPRPKPVSFGIEKLMIWVPAPCAIDIIKDMAATSTSTSTSYKSKEEAQIRRPTGAFHAIQQM